MADDLRQPKHPPGSDGDALITKMLIVGKTSSEINRALKRKGLETVSKQAISDRRQSPLVQKAIQEAIQEAIESGAGTKRRRIRKYDDLIERFDQLIEARGKELEAEVAGGGTGLLVRNEKMIGQGDAAHHVIEYRADTAVIKELRELLKQAAIERGEWTVKQELSGPNGAPIPVVFDAALLKVYGDGPGTNSGD